MGWSKGEMTVAAGKNRIQRATSSAALRTQCGTIAGMSTA